jgi:hypothetical protein
MLFGLVINTDWSNADSRKQFLQKPNNSYYFSINSNNIDTKGLCLDIRDQL